MIRRQIAASSFLGVSFFGAGELAAQLPSAAPAPAAEPAPPFVPASIATEQAASEPAPFGPHPAIVPPQSRQREVSLEPKVAEFVAPGRATFAVDPLADGAIIGISFGFTLVLDQLKSTGEIRPQQISTTFDRNDLLGIDRAAVTTEHRPSAGTWSNVGVTTALVFAALDPLLSAYREHSLQTGLVDFVLYAETLALTQATTNLVKLAVRRPRPAAYVAFEANRDDPNYSNADTDSALSFFSGHASTTASLGAAATYLAFARSRSTWRPWVTLLAAAGLTTFVSVQRVRAGEHFPTDVIAGAVAGAGIGVMVPHLHRTEDVKQRPVWVGYAPVLRHGHALTLSGNF